MNCKIFYSWQSDLPNPTNRGFIGQALENAAKAIRNDDSIQVEPVVDRDTAGVPGAPDIASTILAKIEQAQVFICDVSIINQGTRSRPTPNPNVLIELGYAMKALGAERIIMVMNSAFGSPELLPFDLRMRRVITYDMPAESGERASERRRLEGILTEGLRAIFAGVEAQTLGEVVQPPSLSEDELNDLVQEVRSYCHEMIQYQCGTMRSLTMSQPIDVSELYTNVNILEKIPSRQWCEVDEMVPHCKPENFDRFGRGKITDRGIPGLKAVEKYSKLMVLGKPGSGKTTFLKHLAVQCNRGDFQAHRVPIFITLKQFAEAEGQPSLLEYITQMF